jgi:hypothetical protein
MYCIACSRIEKGGGAHKRLHEKPYGEAAWQQAAEL